jgi:hypothetical protein
MWSGISTCGKNAVFGRVITGTSSGSVISISIEQERSTGRAKFNCVMLRRILARMCHTV